MNGERLGLITEELQKAHDMEVLEELAESDEVL